MNDEVDYSQYVVLLKPNYLSKDGIVKPAIKMVTKKYPYGVYLAPKSDLNNIII